MELNCDYMSPYTARERNLPDWDLKSVIELISLTLCMLICQCWLKFRDKVSNKPRHIPGEEKERKNFKTTPLIIGALLHCRLEA